MSKLKFAAILAIIVSICISAVSGAAITANGGTIPAPEETRNFSIVIDSLPDGLVACGFTISLGDPSRADITGVIVPEWASFMPDVSPVPADSVDIFLIDWEGLVMPGATNEEIVKIQIRGESNGTTPLLLSDVYIEDPNKVWTTFSIQNGTITIGSTSPPPTTGSINVQSVPVGAEVYLNNVYKGITNLTLSNLAPGSYAVKVQKSGYAVYEETVDLTAGETETVMAVLSVLPTTGSINVQSVPVGAEVYLNNVYKGITNLTLSNLAPGSYAVKVQKSGYAVYEETVDLTAGETETVMAVLSVLPTTGSINVQSVPVGANVYLDGELKGLTPYLIQGVTPGQHTVSIEKDGYQPWQISIEVTAGTTYLVGTELEEIESPRTGSINVQSVPVGANVYLDGELKGLTPYLIQGVTPGQHTVSIEKDGYQPWQISIEVTAGTTYLVGTELEEIPIPTTGSITVQSEPIGADVFFDETFRGTSPLTIINVTPGQHTIRLVKVGYYENEQQVTIAAGETLLINVTLISIPPTQPPVGNGMVVVASSPTNARVYIDGVEKGVTFAIIPNVPAGDHTVTVNKSGYKPKSVEIHIVDGERITLPLIRLEPLSMPTIIPPPTQYTILPTLIPTPNYSISPPLPPGPTTGSIFAYSVPIGSSITIDGISRGTSPRIVSGLTPGIHNVSFTLSGYHEETRLVITEAGKITPVITVMMPDISSLVAAPG